MIVDWICRLASRSRLFLFDGLKGFKLLPFTNKPTYLVALYSLQINQSRPVHKREKRSDLPSLWWMRKQAMLCSLIWKTMFPRCRSKRSGLAISKNVVCDEETPQSTGFMKHELYFDLKLVFHEVHIQSSRHRNVIAIAWLFKPLTPKASLLIYMFPHSWHHTYIIVLIHDSLMSTTSSVVNIHLHESESSFISDFRL